MQDLIDLIVFALMLISIATLVFFLYKLKLQEHRVQNRLLQAMLDKTALLEVVSTLSAEKDANSLKEDDGFIKFLSNSRDWAFAYIEDVQSKMKDFQETVDPLINNLNKTRDVNVKALIKAYKNLAEIMPDKESVISDTKEK